MQEFIFHLIHSTKYQLQVTYYRESKRITFCFICKQNNYRDKTYLMRLPDELMKDDGSASMRQLCKYRNLYIQQTKTITLLLEQKHQFMWSERTDLPDKQEQFIKSQCNYQVKYWKKLWEQLEINIALDLHYKVVEVSLLQRDQYVKAGETTITLKQLMGQKSPLKGKYQENELLQMCFECIIKSTAFNIEWENQILKMNHELLQQIELNKISIQSKVPKQLSIKLELFKHIFLTELITHMIINRFSRLKDKHEKYRQGNERCEYVDEELEELRSWGHRFSEFRDHPFKRKKKDLQKSQKNNQKADDNSSDDDYEDDDQDDQEGIEDIQQSDSEEDSSQRRGKNKQNTKGEKEKRKTKIQKMKEKMKKIEKICNFTFISGKQKSKINIIRYCLHQMTKETDKTQALIDFIRFVFKVQKKQQLIGKWNEGKHQNQIGVMSCFLSRFKVRRIMSSCFVEYTKQSFFHRVLNIGLRVLTKPYELVYLRLPFSHLFWSIKSMYHRHKKAIFSKDNQKKVILLYRGFEIGDKEIKKIKKSIGGYIQTEGFLSTTLSKQRMNSFFVNAKMIIQVPTINFGGMHDNGFAHISSLSEHPLEKEVLVNTFNVFKILSLHSVFDEDAEIVIHTLSLQYGSLKQVEQKVKKSEKLLDSQFMRRMNVKEFEKATYNLAKNKEKLTKDMYQKLAALLPKAENQLKRRKKQLEQWAQEELEEMLGKLSQWEKELIVNAKHQEKQIKQIENYGSLLLHVGEFRRASIYLDKIMKQIERDRAIQGFHWRKSQGLVHRQMLYRHLLLKCDFRIGKSEASFSNASKTLDLYHCTNRQKSNIQYWTLLYEAYTISLTLEDKHSQMEEYKKDLVTILTENKQSLSCTKLYKHMIEDKIQANETADKQSCSSKKEEEQEVQAHRRKYLKQKKDELKYLELYTYGKYSPEYLSELCQLFSQLREWQEQEQMLQVGLAYLSIRKQRPQIEHRIQTCLILEILLTLCSGRSEFQLLCSHLASFFPATMHTIYEWNTLRSFFNGWLKNEWWRKEESRVGRALLMKLINAKIYIQLPHQTVFFVVLAGYAVLLLSATSQLVIDNFLKWAQNIYRQQQYLPVHIKNYQQILYMVRRNKEYGQRKDMFMPRDKEDEQSRTIIEVKRQAYPHQTILFPEDKRGKMIQWQHPFHPFAFNARKSELNVLEFLGKGQLTWLVGEFRQYLNLYYHLFDPVQASKYLRQLNTLRRLHLNDSHIISLPSLLEFWSEGKQLQLLQVSKLGIDLPTVIQTTQHLKDSLKVYYVQKSAHDKNILQSSNLSRLQLNMTKPEVKRMSSIYKMYKHSLLRTIKRKAKTTSSFI